MHRGRGFQFSAKEEIFEILKRSDSCLLLRISISPTHKARFEPAKLISLWMEATVLYLEEETLKERSYMELLEARRLTID